MARAPKKQPGIGEQIATTVNAGIGGAIEAVSSAAEIGVKAVVKAAPVVAHAVAESAEAAGHALNPVLLAATSVIDEQIQEHVGYRPSPLRSDYDFIHRPLPGRSHAAFDAKAPELPPVIQTGEKPEQIENTFRRAARLPLVSQVGRWPPVADVKRASDLPVDGVVNDPRPTKAYLPYAENLTGAPAEYLARLVSKESDGLRHARSTTGARGPFQFIRPTWESTVAKHGVEQGLPSNIDRDDLWNRADEPRWAAVMGGFHQQDNAAVLHKALGRNPTWGEVYLGHFSGADRAATLIKADQSKPATSFYSRTEIDGNLPSFFVHTGPNRYDRSRPLSVAEHIKYHSAPFPNREWTQYGPTKPAE